MTPTVETLDAEGLVVRRGRDTPRMVGGPQHIAIAGNIGVGKSTLTGLLAQHLEATPFYETVEESVYLERFYRDQTRWSFHSQMFFLTQALAQHNEILNTPGVCIQDRTIYEHFYVFATSLYRQGLMEAADFELLDRHFHTLSAMIPHPELVIYLRASVPTLRSRIAHRKRLVESDIATEYLQGLQREYETWMERYQSNDRCDVLTIDTDEIDIHNDDDRAALLDAIADVIASPQLSLQAVG